MSLLTTLLRLKKKKMYSYRKFLCAALYTDRVSLAQRPCTVKPTVRFSLKDLYCFITIIIIIALLTPLL